MIHLENRLLFIHRLYTVSWSNLVNLFHDNYIKSVQVFIILLFMIRIECYDVVGKFYNTSDLCWQLFIISDDNNKRQV